ncbi:MAG: HAD family hydrolase [Lachnospiraceae bacterium]|nr:HAD family hydrolase [Lachnospiraceae bacterium]
MKEYDNYIFDLYGTLIDLDVDEKKTELWDVLASLYSVYGCDYRSKEMMELFFEMDEEERISVVNSRGFKHAEIRLERVYTRLLFECGRVHPVTVTIAGKPVDALRKDYGKDREKVIELVQESDWCVEVANLFRILSRKYIKLFPGTVSVLKGLRERGKKVFLLSNAQKIFTMPEIEATGLNRCFDRMYISSDYYVKKPDTVFMDRLIEDEGLDRSRSVMVGDDPVNDASMAVLSDMDCILLNTSDCSKKEIDEVVNRAVEEKGGSYHGCVTVVNTISDIDHSCLA